MEAKLLEEFKAAGHEPELDEDGLPDFMAYSQEDPDSMGGHNGPQCTKCCYAICEWCWLRYGHRVEGPCQGE